MIFDTKKPEAAGGTISTEMDAEDREGSFCKRKDVSLEKSVTHKMSREEALQELKTKAIEIKARLDFLEMRIGKIQNGASPTSQWKAFVDPEKCEGCRACEKACPFDAISIEKYARVDIKKCIGCGRCVRECPEGALSLRPSDYPAQVRPVSWQKADETYRMILRYSSPFLKTGPSRRKMYLTR